MKQEVEVERDGAKNRERERERLNLRRQEAEEGKRQGKEGGGQNKGDKDVRGRRGDKWRRAGLLNLRGSPQEGEEMIHSLTGKLCNRVLLHGG